MYICIKNLEGCSFGLFVTSGLTCDHYFFPLFFDFIKIFNVSIMKTKPIKHL